jgi:hypothetical protein
MASNLPTKNSMCSECAAKKTPDDTMYYEFEYRLLCVDENSTEMMKMTLMFDDRYAKMWSDWLIEFDDIICLVPLNTTNQKTNAVFPLFKGKFQQHFKEFN